MEPRYELTPEDLTALQEQGIKIRGTTITRVGCHSIGNYDRGVEIFYNPKNENSMEAALALRDYCAEQGIAFSEIGLPISVVREDLEERIKRLRKIAGRIDDIIRAEKSQE